MLSLLMNMGAVEMHRIVPDAVVNIKNPKEIKNIKEILTGLGVHEAYVNKSCETAEAMDKALSSSAGFNELTILRFRKRYMDAYFRSGRDPRVFNLKPNAVTTCAMDHWDLGALVYPDLESKPGLKVDGYHIDAWEAARGYAGGKGDLVLFRRHPFAKEATDILKEAVRLGHLKLLGGFIFPKHIVSKYEENPPRVGKAALLLNPRTDWYSLSAMGQFNAKVSKKVKAQFSKPERGTYKVEYTSSKATLAILGATNGRFSMPVKINDARAFLKTQKTPITIGLPKNQLSALKVDTHPMLDGVATDENNKMIQGIAMGARLLGMRQNAEVIFYVN